MQMNWHILCKLLSNNACSVLMDFMEVCVTCMWSSENRDDIRNYTCLPLAKWQCTEMVLFVILASFPGIVKRVAHACGKRSFLL